MKEIFLYIGITGFLSVFPAVGCGLGLAAYWHWRDEIRKKRKAKFSALPGLVFVAADDGRRVAGGAGQDRISGNSLPAVHCPDHPDPLRTPSLALFSVVGARDWRFTGPMIKLGLLYFLLIGLVELTPIYRIHWRRWLEGKLKRLKAES